MPYDADVIIVGSGPAGCSAAHFLTRQGCRVLILEKKVTLTSADGKSFTAKYVIGGDGPHSRVAAAMNLRRNKQNGIALEVEAEVPQDVLRFFQGRVLAGFDVLPVGYYWVFPKADHLSVGIGSLSSKKQALFPTLQKHLSRHGIDISTSRPKAHPLSIFTHLESLQQDRVLLVGDAAGLVDPYTGEGIRHAMLSGKIASECILQGSIKHYTRRIHDEIARDLLWAGRLARFFYSKQAFSFHYLVRNRFIFQEMLKTITNQTSYKKSIQIWPLYLLHIFKRQALDVQGFEMSP